MKRRQKKGLRIRGGSAAEASSDVIYGSRDVIRRSRDVSIGISRGSRATREEVHDVDGPIDEGAFEQLFDPVGAEPDGVRAANTIIVTAVGAVDAAYAAYVKIIRPVDVIDVINGLLGEVSRLHVIAVQKSKQRSFITFEGEHL